MPACSLQRHFSVAGRRAFAGCCVLQALTPASFLGARVLPPARSSQLLTRGSSRSMGLFLGKGCTYDSEGALVSCVFCDIYNNKNRLTEVVFQDEKCIVFLPLDRCASHHYLVVPRTHIRNVSGLRKEHLPTLDMMLEVGQKVVRERSPDSDPSTHQYVFHVPPFNSIDHLHLHCQVPPFKSFLASQKYKPDTRWCMSFEKLRSRIEEGLTVP